MLFIKRRKGVNRLVVCNDSWDLVGPYLVRWYLYSSRSSPNTISSDRDHFTFIHEESVALKWDDQSSFCLPEGQVTTKDI